MNGSDWGQFLIEEAEKAHDAGRTIVRLVPLQPGGLVVDGGVDLAGRRFPVTVELAGITFTGRVDLADSRFDASLNVDSCTFEQGLVLRDARIDGNCRLRSCEFEDEVYKFLDFRRLHVTGRLNLACSTSHVGIDLTSLTCNDEVRLDGLHATAAIKERSDIDLPLDAAPGLKQHLNNFMISVAVQMRGADIRRDLLLYNIDGRPTKLTGSADFRANVGMTVYFSGATVDAGKGSRAVNMDSAEVGGAVFFRNGTHLTGYVDLRAKVGGAVDFENATVLAEPGSMAVNLETADVGGAVFFRNGTHITGYIDLRAKIGVGVAFENATILAEPRSRAVNLNAADVGGSVFFYNGTHITGHVGLRAKVGRQVSFNNVTVLSEPGSMAVNMDSAEVGGAVFFRNGTHITGHVDLRAKVGGQVNFDNATVLAEPGSMAVNMYNTDVDGLVLFGNGTHITGHVDLRAKVGGQVNFDNATVLAEPGSGAVFMAEADVGGSVFFRNGTHITGHVDLRAKVGGQVNFDNATVAGETGSRALFMKDADVGGSVFIMNNTVLVGTLVATSAKLRNGFRFTNESLPSSWSRPDSIEINTSTAPCAVRIGGIDLSFAEVFGPVYVHAASVSGPIVARHLKVHGEMDVCGSVVGQRSLSDDEKKLAERSADGSKPGFGDWGEAATAEPTSEGQRAIDLDMAQIGGRLWLKGSRVLGDVYAEDVEVTGEVNLDQVHVLGDVTLRSAKVHGRVFNDASAEEPSPQVRGKVDLSYAEVEQVDLKFGRGEGVLMPSYVDLSAAKCGSLQLRGELDCGDGSESAAPTQIGVDGLKFETLDCSDLSGKKRPAFTQRDVARVLLGAFVVALAGMLFGLSAAGWVLLVVLLGHAGLLLWIVKQPLPGVNADRDDDGLFTLLDRSFPFSAGFYQRVEGWLRETSNDPVADEVFLSRRKREASEPRPVGELPDGIRPEADQRGGPLRRLWMFALDFFVGYGVRPQRLVTAYLLLWLLSTAVFSSRKSVERPLVFVQPATDAESAGDGPELDPDEPNPWLADGGYPNAEDWGLSHAFFMALRVQVPFLSVLTESEVEPSSRNLTSADWPGGLTFENYAATAAAANLVLIPLMIAGATGLLKRDKLG